LLVVVRNFDVFSPYPNRPGFGIIQHEFFSFCFFRVLLPGNFSSSSARVGSPLIASRIPQVSTYIMAHHTRHSFCKPWHHYSLHPSLFPVICTLTSCPLEVRESRIPVPNDRPSLVHSMIFITPYFFLVYFSFPSAQV